METLKLIVDVEAEDGMTRDRAIQAALKEARTSDEVLGLAVEEIHPRFARYKKEENIWQVMADVIEKKAEFPPSKDEDDSSDDDLPKKVEDAVSEEEPKKDDASDIKGILMDFIGQLQDLVDNLDGGDGPKLPEEGEDLDLPPVGGPGPGGPPMRKKVGPPKPPMMARRREARYLPKTEVGSRQEVITSARELPKTDPELRGMRLARVGENQEGTHYVATFVR
jgi:hypothetical protein